MFYVSEIQTTAPVVYKTPLQKSVYETLERLQIPFERVDTDEAVTMEDCASINRKLQMDMVKTLFLCNRQQTSFYLFVTKGVPVRSLQQSVGDCACFVCACGEPFGDAGDKGRGCDGIQRFAGPAEPCAARLRSGGGGCGMVWVQ